MRYEVRLKWVESWKCKVQKQKTHKIDKNSIMQVKFESAVQKNVISMCTMLRR